MLTMTWLIAGSLKWPKPYARYFEIAVLMLVIAINHLNMFRGIVQKRSFLEGVKILKRTYANKLATVRSAGQTVLSLRLRQWLLSIVHPLCCAVDNQFTNAVVVVRLELRSVDNA
jgi:hypothetical protein